MQHSWQEAKPIYLFVLNQFISFNSILHKLHLQNIMKHTTKIVKIIFSWSSETIINVHHIIIICIHISTNEYDIPDFGSFIEIESKIFKVIPKAIPLYFGSFLQDINI